MNDTLLRIDPSLPLCWESTETLRVGFDHAEVRLHDPAPRHQRFISLLQRGLLVGELAAATRKTGITARERTALLDELAPVLERVPLEQAHAYAQGQSPVWPAPGDDTGSVEVIGEGEFAHLLRSALQMSGFEVAEGPCDSPAFAILLERFVGAATRAHHLVIYEVPHIPVRLSDRSMLIGPLVLPPGRPCLACVELHDSERDPLRTALAAQLLSVRPGAETTACAEVAAAVCSTLLRQRGLGVPELRGTRLKYAVRAGVPSVLPRVERIAPRPECACVAYTEQGEAGDAQPGRPATNGAVSGQGAARPP